MRLLFDDEWFDAVASSGQYEHDFEAIVTHRARSLFAGYHALPFKVAVESEHERKMPDLALVDLEYRDWWVVEVEMAHHSLHGHVLPQVEVFANGVYTEEHVTHMAKQASRLSPWFLRDMMKAAQPGVLVVVNKGVPGWMEAVERAGGRLAIVEVFRSERNRHVLRVDGYWPVVHRSDVVTSGQLDRTLSSLLRIWVTSGIGSAGGRAAVDSISGWVNGLDAGGQWERRMALSCRSESVGGGKGI